VDTVSVIIVTYNTGKTILETLESLSTQSDDISTQIIVVDNQSTDETTQLIQGHYPAVNLVVSETNRGFGGGNNYGFQSSSGDFIALVNPDLRVHPSMLTMLVQYLKANPHVGVVGPQTIDADGEISVTAHADYSLTAIALSYFGLAQRFPGLFNQHDLKINHGTTQPQIVDWLQGSCLMMPREVYNTVGGFDEAFFLYVEDVDLCHRIRATGKQVVYYPQATATHLQGTSARNFPYFRVRGYHLSPLYFFRKRGQHMHVRLLKLIFTAELLFKISARRLYNLFKYDSLRASQAAAELKVLAESWRY
jgi:GT2 family glycosyltransferase